MGAMRNLGLTDIFGSRQREKCSMILKKHSVKAAKSKGLQRARTLTSWGKNNIMRALCRISL